MPLHLRIENETSLPDGGPISYMMQSSRGGINIGRDQYLDWVLPDPTRFVSGTHCEIRYRSSQFWVHDVSTNGTFLNGSEYRLAGPHALRSGDRLEIGRYIVVVEIEGEQNSEPARDLAAMNSQLPADGPMVWSMPDQDAPEPIDPRVLDHRRNARSLNSGSFLDWMADLPSVVPSPAAAPPPTPPAPQPPARSPAPPVSDQWLQAPGPWDAPAPETPQAFPAPYAPPQAAPSTPPPVASWDPIPFEAPDAPPPRMPSASLPAGLAAFEPAPPPVVPPPVAPPSAPPPSAPQPFAPPPPQSASAPQWDLPPLPQEQPAPAWSEPAAPPQAQPAPPAYSAPPVSQAPNPVSNPAPSPAAYAPPPAQNGGYARGEASTQDFMARFARGARLPRDAFRQMDPGDFAEMVGELVMLTVENLRQLQLARAQFKGKIRSSNHTMIGPLDNNPLRFSPSADAALRIMFGPPQEGYLNAVRAVDNAFDDIKQHQVATVGALQNAVQKSLAAVSPKAVEAAVPGDKGVGNLLGTRKARLWEKYCELWKGEFGDDEEAALAAFLRSFAASYNGRK